MTAKEQKIIKAKVGLLELAKQLGNVSQACNLLSGAANGAALTVTELTGGTSRRTPTGHGLRPLPQRRRPGAI